MRLTGSSSIPISSAAQRSNLLRDFRIDRLVEETGGILGAGTVVVQGEPQDGWTLVSWDGMPVPPALECGFPEGAQDRVNRVVHHTPELTSAVKLRRLIERP